MIYNIVDYILFIFIVFLTKWDMHMIHKPISKKLMQR